MNMTFEEFVTRARELRDVKETAEIEHLLFLHKMEAHEEVWKRGQARLSYEHVLKQEYLCDPARYCDFRLAMEGLGEKVIRAAGVDASVAALKLKGAMRERYLNEVVAAHKEHGQPVSKRYAMQVLKALTAPEAIQFEREQRKQRAEERQTVEEKEIKLLRARVRELERECSRLRKRLSKYEPDIQSTAASS